MDHFDDDQDFFFGCHLNIKQDAQTYSIGTSGSIIDVSACFLGEGVGDFACVRTSNPMIKQHPGKSPAERLALDVADYNRLKADHLKTAPTQVFTDFEGPVNPGTYKQHKTELKNMLIVL